MDVVTLSETKKKGKGEEEMGDYIHFRSGVPKSARAKAGISIAIRKKLKSRIIGWECINERLIIITYKYPHKMSIFHWNICTNK